MTIQAPPATPQQLLYSISGIIDAVDERARQTNRKWGTNRLPLIVPIEWMEKFRSQKRKWELAVFESCPVPTQACLDRVRKQGEAYLRAFDKLEELAVADGHLPTPPKHWEFELTDGTPVILVRDRAELEQVDPQGRTVQMWSLEEIVTIIEKFPILVAAKTSFPGAEVLQTRTSPIVVDELNDSLEGLPF